MTKKQKNHFHVLTPIELDRFKETLSLYGTAAFDSLTRKAIQDRAKSYYQIIISVIDDEPFSIDGWTEGEGNSYMSYSCAIDYVKDWDPSHENFEVKSDQWKEIEDLIKPLGFTMELLFNKVFQTGDCKPDFTNDVYELEI